MEQFYLILPEFNKKFRDIESFRRGRREIEGYFSEGFFATSDPRYPTSDIYTAPGVSFQLVANEENRFISLGFRKFEREITIEHLSKLKKIFEGFSDKNIKKGEVIPFPLNI